MTNGVSTLGQPKTCKNRPSINIGDHWNLLTIVSKDGRNKNGAQLFKCVCDCGKLKTYIGSTIRSGAVVSCGCYTRGIMKGRHLGRFRVSKHKTLDKSARNILFTDYKSKAKKFNLNFDVSLDEFSSLTKLNCYYCGSPPARLLKRSQSPYQCECLAQGIDRVDSQKGYQIDNVVPCCETCNRAKLDLPQTDFFKWVERVFRFRHFRETSGNLHWHNLISLVGVCEAPQPIIKDCYSFQLL